MSRESYILISILLLVSWFVSLVEIQELNSKLKEVKKPLICRVLVDGYGREFVSCNNEEFEICGSKE
jgi:hypothetical protein